MANKYKVEARVRECDCDDGILEIFVNNYTRLETPKRSTMNQVLNLKPGDKVNLTIEVEKRK